MEDSFFGFDTTAPLDDDGGGPIAEPSEEEYDALNDETFGSAINGDWEKVHENLVRMTDGKDSPDKVLSTLNKNEEDSDLEINLSSMKLDDVDITFDDGDAGINLDPLVWANPIITPPSTGNLTSNNNDRRPSLLYSTPEAFLREHFPTPFNAGQQISANVKQTQQRQQQQQPPQPPQLQQSQRSSFPLPPIRASAPKICTVEDIERSIIAQQQQQKQQKEQQQQQQLQHQQQMQQQHHHQQQQINQQQQQQHHRQVELAAQMIASAPKPKTPIISQQSSQHMHQQQPLPPPQQHPHPAAGHHHPPPQPQPQHPPHPQHPQPQQPIHHQPPLKFPFPNTSGPPPGFTGPRPGFNNLQQPHPLNNLLHPAGPPNHHNRHLPPGFQPVPMFPPGMPGPHQLPNYPPRPMPNLPIALNNFAMHPNFNAVRRAVPPLVPPCMPPHLNLVNPTSGPVSAYNMFNQRLVQEIQQNHPMLPNTRNSFISPNNTIGPNQHPQHQQQHNRQERKHSGGHNTSHGSSGNGHHVNIGHSHPGNMRSTGNLPVEYDEYANLMSARDKHWLISIQLTQLNTDTPYIDDYYYTIFKERRAELNGDSGESKTHKDNQLNHPLTQPKGHAQMILVSLGNKNGMNNRNGQNNRERKNSESKNDQEQQRKYVYTPLKFENSLGKLQCGSVTAPRKLIDMDIMGPESSPQLSTNIELSAQRKSRYILLHIETLYRIILKLEDLDNPAAVETIKIKKEKEKERLQLLEQMENENRESTGDVKSADTTTPSAISSALKTKFEYELEPKHVLMARLIAGLAHDKVVVMMTIRKGKALVRRVMKHIKDEEARWNVWISVFSSLQSVLKKDRDDSEGVLFALYPEFRNHVKTANFETVLKLSAAIPLSDKKSNSLFSSKFVISSLVCLILQAEQIYIAATDDTLTSENQETWRLFLDSVAISLNRTIQNQTICAAIESDSIQPMMDHFARFKDLKLDALLALITQAKQQIN